jgi:nucleoside 2-deoxyribosyltransferase/sugar/nucleoside kinase (ribokinase family)
MIVVVGGTYRERCVQPRWDALYGSAGRAAAALSYVHDTQLVTYVGDDSRRELEVLARTCGAAGFNLDAHTIPATISFDYVHPLSVPVIQPPPQLLKHAAPLAARGDVVLRFGMMEATAVVEGDRVVYDPQSAYAPEPFRKNGSVAGSLAIVANGYEVQLMTSDVDPERGGRAILATEGAEVVVVKRGSLGAMVLTAKGARFDVPAYRTPSVFSIGSGDMFAAAFTLFWAVESLPPAEAAELASRATARYCASQAVELLPKAALSVLPYTALAPKSGKVYLAGPFFTLPERWLIEEARTHLRAMHLDVFSPVHDVGLGPADKIAKADLAGLDGCDRVLAIIDSADPGTLFEVGYARALGKPVVALTETLTEEKKKMFAGSGCTCTDDFATALYLTAWAA